MRAICYPTLIPSQEYTVQCSVAAVSLNCFNIINLQLPLSASTNWLKLGNPLHCRQVGLEELKQLRSARVKYA